MILRVNNVLCIEQESTADWSMHWLCLSADIVDVVVCCGMSECVSP